MKAVFVTVALLVTGIAISWPHWLRPHGQITCDGRQVQGATLYRSGHGDVFALLPNQSEGMPAVYVSDRLLLRCNSPAFTSVLGMLFSREADPSTQCGTMWKGAGSNDEIPAHEVTAHFAEFPWGECTKLRLEY